MAVVISSLLYPQDGKYLLNEQLHGQMKVWVNELGRRLGRSLAGSPGWGAGCPGENHGDKKSRKRPDKTASARVSLQRLEVMNEDVKEDAQEDRGTTGQAGGDMFLGKMRHSSCDTWTKGSLLFILGNVTVPVLRQQPLWVFLGLFLSGLPGPALACSAFPGCPSSYLFQPLLFLTCAHKEICLCWRLRFKWGGALAND